MGLITRTWDSSPFTQAWAGNDSTELALRESADHQVRPPSFIDNLLVRIHFIIVMIRWTGLASWEFEFPFPGSLTSIYLPKLLSLSLYPNSPLCLGQVFTVSRLTHI